MIRKLRRLGFVTVIIAGATLATAASLPAAVAMTPQLNGYETSITYYNNAQHSEIVGAYDTGCFTFQWGTASDYSTTTETVCYYDGAQRQR
jgi:hypothetical protein